MGKGKWVARQAHDLKVGGSNPSPATNPTLTIHDRKPIIQKIKSNREIIKSIQPINVGEYLKIRNRKPIPTERIEPIIQKDRGIKQGIDLEI